MFSMHMRKLYIKPYRYKQNLNTDLLWKQLQRILFLTVHSDVLLLPTSEYSMLILLLLIPCFKLFWQM